MSLVVVSFGCGDETNGTGGNGGDGGNGGAMPTDACINQNDLAIVCDSQFNIEVQICATDEAGDAEKTSMCLQRDTGVSEACADCYGETTQCTLDHCLNDLCPTLPFSPECAACRAEFCNAEFDACRGALAIACPRPE